MAQYATIMVVDDNPAILTAAKITLQPHFENVITLSSPKDIISTLNQEEVNAILLDMNFTAGMNSGHDGLQWLENIHKLHPDVPVVLITAYADVKLAVTGLKMGAALSVACVCLFALTMFGRTWYTKKKLSKNDAGVACEQKVD